MASPDLRERARRWLTARGLHDSDSLAAEFEAVRAEALAEAAAIAAKWRNHYNELQPEDHTDSIRIIGAHGAAAIISDALARAGQPPQGQGDDA